MWRYLQGREKLEHLSGLCMGSGAPNLPHVQLKACHAPPKEISWQPHMGGFQTPLLNDHDRQRFLQPFGFQPTFEYIQGIQPSRPLKEAVLGQRLLAYPYFAPTRQPRPAEWTFQKQ
jgi:hypothetical protein